MKWLRIHLWYYPLASFYFLLDELRWELFTTSLYFRDKGAYRDAMEHREEFRRKLLRKRRAA